MIKISTDTLKLPDVKLLDGVTPITGTTESAPFSFPGMDGKALTATAHDGAGITGTIYKHDGSIWNEIRSVSGTTPVTVNLPALDSSENEAFYKITLKASLTGYAESNEKEFFVKLLRQELPVLKLKQDFGATALPEQKNISAATKGYVTEDIIPDVSSYTAESPLAIYNLTGKAQFLLTPRTGSTATVKYTLDGGTEQTPSGGAITVTTSGAHTLKVWAVKYGVEGHKTILHIKVIGAVTTYRELKNVVQNAPAGNEIGINIDSDLTAPYDIGNTEIAVTDGKKLTLRPNSGHPSHTINAYENGRIFNIRGGTELILDNIQLRYGRVNGEKGGAAYVENGGVLALTGKTVITPSTEEYVNTPGENDVYLAAGALIKIDSALTSTEPIVARITPESYSESTQVLTGTTLLLDSEHDKFTVTQNSDPEYVWAIKNDGTLEKISKTINANASSDAWRKLRKLVRIAPTGTVITIDGEIKATNDSGNSGEIVIDKNLTIQGATDAASDILDANSNHIGTPHRIFKVSSHEMLTLKELTLKNGYAGNGSAGKLGTKGGGILLENGSVSLSNVIVSGCKASTNSSWHGDGAGIYVKSGAIIMKNSKLSANVASAYGGGIYVNENGWLTMRGSNTITGCSASCGGAICVSGATVNITGCTITGNTALNGNGGGIYTKKTDSKASTITIKDGAIIGGTGTGKANKATGAGADSGLGGGIYIGEGCSLKVQSGAQVIGNEATQDGGGIYLNKIGAHGEMSSGKIQNNTAENGGGVYIAGGTDVNEHASFTLKVGTIIANTATDSGGGVEAFGGGIFTMEGGTIEHNTAHNHGGGVQVLSGTMNMTGGSIESNTANKDNNTEKGGGGVALGINNGPALLDMSGGTISRNTIGTPGKGAGIQVLDGTNAVTVKMSGTARIDADNDVYLKDGRKITVAGQLNPLGGVAAACITPENYNTTTQVLAGSITGGTPQNYTKFTVTPKGSTRWYVGSDGCLTTAQP